MKTVIVFDTEDHEGMQNTLKIVDHLAQRYLGAGVKGAQQRSFGKIKFIKALRRYEEQCRSHLGDDPEFRAGLKSAKVYADLYWEQNDS
jgi:hypothetical protein